MTPAENKMRKCHAHDCDKRGIFAFISNIKGLVNAIYCEIHKKDMIKSKLFQRCHVVNISQYNDLNLAEIEDVLNKLKLEINAIEKEMKKDV